MKNFFKKYFVKQLNLEKIKKLESKIIGIIIFNGYGNSVKRIIYKQVYLLKSINTLSTFIKSISSFKCFKTFKKIMLYKPDKEINN